MDAHIHSAGRYKFKVVHHEEQNHDPITTDVVTDSNEKSKIIADGESDT